MSHIAPVVEVWLRDETGSWSSQRRGAGERVRLRSIGCDLVIDDLYRDLPTERESGKDPGV